MPDFSDPVFIAKVVDFVALVGGIVYLYQRAGKAQLVALQEAQNKAVDDAVAHRETRARDVEAAKAALEQAKVTAVRMVEGGTAQAKEIVDDEVAQARAHAQRVLAHADGELERERYRVRRELLEETVERAHAQARDLIRAGLTSDKQRSLVERMVSDLERAHG